MSHLGTGNESDVAGLLDVPASPADLALLKKISEKQADALRLTLLGESSKEIARKLKVTPRGIDQRLDAARKTLGAASRGEAARKFYQLYCASEGLTSDPFLLGEHAGRQRSEPGEHSHYVFGDALTFSAPAVWENDARSEIETWRRFAPGLPNAASGTRDRIMWIMIGAIAILMLLVVGLAAKEGLVRAFQGG